MALIVVPLPGQSLASSRDQISGNFSVIDTAFTVNHIPYSDVSGNQGKHFFIQFPSNSSPGAVGVAELALYQKNSGAGVTNQPELYLKRNAGTDVPFTAGKYTAGSPAASGWYYTPSGFLVQFGKATISNINGSFTVTFGTTNGTKAFATGIYNFMVSATANSPANNDVVIAFGSVTVSAAPGTAIIYMRKNGAPVTGLDAMWWAIGV